MFLFYTILASIYAFAFDESKTTAESCLFYFKCGMTFSMIGFVINVGMVFVNDYRKRYNLYTN